MNRLFKQIKTLVDGVVTIRSEVDHLEQKMDSVEKIGVDLREIVADGIKIDPSSQELEESQNKKDMYSMMQSQDDLIEE